MTPRERAGFQSWPTASAASELESPGQLNAVKGAGIRSGRP